MNNHQGFEKAIGYLPKELQEVLSKLPTQVKDRVQEIRIRLHAPLMISASDGEWMITKQGTTTQSAENTVCCGPAMLEDCFLTLCEYSVHTHQQELRAGFVTTPNGCRAGIAGTAVVENGMVQSMRNITSICLRVSRSHEGCASALASSLFDGSRLYSALLCGEPSSGKSSLLRDLARQLSTGSRGKRFRTAVVDERGELSGDGSLGYCDVLKHCPKAAGIQRAVRCLAPDVVIFDEMGTASEVEAVLEGLNTGVAAIASAHCRDKESLLRRPALVSALASGAFDRVVFLEGRRYPGTIAKIMEAGDVFDQSYRAAVGSPYGGGNGIIRIGRLEPSGRRI